MVIKSIQSPESGSGLKMKVKVQYFGSVRVIANRNEEEVEISSNATVHELLQKLSSIHGEAFESEVFQEEGENLRDDLIIAINETIIKQTDFMTTKMKPDDTITLLPIFPGGG